MPLQFRRFALVPLLIGASMTLPASDPTELALQVLSSASAPADLGDAWMIHYPDLADALEHLGAFESAGAPALDFKPHAPQGLTVSMRTGADAPPHWVLANQSSHNYAGRVWLPSNAGAAGYFPLWATKGVSCLPQTARSQETTVDLVLPARSVLALRPAISIKARKDFEAEITDILDNPGKLEVKFRVDPSRVGSQKQTLGATIFIERNAQLTNVIANGKEMVSFAPVKHAGKIRPIPCKIEQLREQNHLMIKYRPWMLITLEPERLKSFPFYRRAGAKWYPKTWVCVDDEASDNDKKWADVLALAFADPNATPPRPPLKVIPSDQADGRAGPIPKGGPNRISIGPRDSLLFPSFGFQPDEKLHVQGGGMLAAMADDPDGYKVIYLVGKTDADRAKVVRRLLGLLRSQGLIRD